MGRTAGPTMRTLRTNAAPDHLTRHRRAGAARLVWIAVTAAVAATAAALAIPRFLGGDEVTHLVGPMASEMPPAAAQAPRRPAAETRAATPAAAPKPAAAATSADGDLVLEVVPRIATPVAGTPVEATVRFVNTTLAAFHLPAPSEPHPTLALVVLDADANEVRRVVETGPDPYPRRTTLVAAGGAMEVPLMVVSADDAPLPPGEYTIHAEFRRDPVWSRLGLPVWTAPNGTVRSPQVPVRVLPRE